MYHLKNKRDEVLMNDKSIKKLIDSFIKRCIGRSMLAGERVTSVFDGNKFIIERGKRYVGIMYWFRSKTLKQDLLIVKVRKCTKVFDLAGKPIFTKE